MIKQTHLPCRFLRKPPRHVCGGVLFRALRESCPLPHLQIQVGFRQGAQPIVSHLQDEPAAPAIDKASCHASNWLKNPARAAENRFLGIARNSYWHNILLPYCQYRAKAITLRIVRMETGSEPDPKGSCGRRGIVIHGSGTHRDGEQRCGRRSSADFTGARATGIRATCGMRSGRLEPMIPPARAGRPAPRRRFSTPNRSNRQKRSGSDGQVAYDAGKKVKGRESTPGRQRRAADARRCQSAAIQTVTGRAWSSTRYAGASPGSNSYGPMPATRPGKLTLRRQRCRCCAWRWSSGATTRRASSSCRAARWSSAPSLGSGETGVSPRISRTSRKLWPPFVTPRFHPAGPQAACRGVDRELNKPPVVNAR
jgi:hypothetical protein